jgi:hypothetical protein
MKKILALSICLFIIGCGVQSGYISVPMGNGTYSISKKANNGYVSIGTLREAVLIDANEFAKTKGKIMEVITFNETAMSLGQVPRIELIFRLVNETEEVADNSQESLNINSSKNGNVGSTQISVKKSNDDVVYDKLLKLGDLLKKGIITQEEFDVQKKKILESK